MSEPDRCANNKSSAPEQDIPAPLRDPYLSGFLSWLVPGLGHLYQGRRAKGIIFAVCVLGTFLAGVVMSSSDEVGPGRAVYASWRPGDRRIYFVPQAMVGLPALPAMIQALRARDGEPPLWGGFMAAPPLYPGEARFGPTLDEIHAALHRYFELGTIYTVVAGLLNLLVIYDAVAGPFVPEDTASKDKKNDDDEDGDEGPPGDGAPRRA